MSLLEKSGPARVLAPGVLLFTVGARGAARRPLADPPPADRVALDGRVSRSAVAGDVGLDTPLRGYSTSMKDRKEAPLRPMLIE
ncbi:hypothetical protein [Rathayibacter sp. VKM Ac-2857]|uniref:hypothetical protein n=1 Tax=Rathayibacter sp. VKM Ac-2857 TaxID=2739020 RepID=UPI001564AD33|nr:hypothetical protein [Rathayibacter sp. VKM Ac-2857]NQX16658.1 hypothetical protein [Rathayibacter sp. VKM Ac-2857]